MINPNLIPAGKPANTLTPFIPAIPRSLHKDGGLARDEVARKAYFLYLNQGCPQGQDRQHWFEAEVQVEAARNLSRPKISART